MDRFTTAQSLVSFSGLSGLPMREEFKQRARLLDFGVTFPQLKGCECMCC